MTVDYGPALRSAALASGFSADLRLAARRLLATPLFTIFAVLSLAFGVGVTTAVYSVVDSIFLKDFGIRDPARVVFVLISSDGRFLNGGISQPDFHDLRGAQTSFTTISASASFSPAVTTPSTTELLPAEAVDGAYFSTLGVGASTGRVIQPADDAGAARVVVLGHGLWRARFAADPTIVGHTIRISGERFEVVGVAPASFNGASGGPPGTSLWIPLSAEAAIVPVPAATSPRERRRLLVVGRLAPSVTIATASAEVAAIAASLDASFPRQAKRPGPSERPWRAKSVAAVTDEDTFPRRVGFMLIALVALVLVVACTNLSNLVLARGTMRQQEVAVRRALGASRWRLVREQLAESSLLATGGAVASYVVFQALRVLMDAEFYVTLPMGRWTVSVQPSLNVTALAIAAAALLMSLVVFGLEPALQLTRSRDVRKELAVGAGDVGIPRAMRQRTLLRWQVAISAGFFIIATMFVRYTIAEARHDSGIDLQRLAVAILNFQTQQWDEARVRRTLDRVLEEARKDPALEAASISTGMPFGVRQVMRLALSMPDKPVPEKGDYAATGIAATPSIFKTLGVSILRGRSFGEPDHAGAPPVIVVSEFTARKIFGTADVVGRRLVVHKTSSRLPNASAIATIIGVARDTDVWRVFDEARPFAYLPLAQRYDRNLMVAARSTGKASLAVRALRDAIRRANPDLAVELSGTGREILAGPSVLLRAMGMAALSLGALTLLLAMVGLFGIQSHVVARRTREIGVRMSFGASAAQIKRMVLKDGYRPVVEGLAIGVFIGLAGRAVVRAYLDVDVDVVDPWMLLVVPIPVILAAFCACYLPAHRAASVDPNVALRHL